MKLYEIDAMNGKGEQVRARCFTYSVGRALEIARQHELYPTKIVPRREEHLVVESVESRVE